MAFGRINTLFNNFWFKKTYGDFTPWAAYTADNGYFLEQLILEKMYNIYLSRLEYKNLPEQFLELIGTRNFVDAQLFFQPSVAWFKDKTHGVICLPTSGEYKYNVVGRPVEWVCWGYNGQRWNLNESNSVIMFNDEAMSIPFLHLQYEAQFMAEADKTAKQNLFAQRQPYMVETDEDTLKSAQATIDQLAEFKPIIFKRKKDKRAEEPIETKLFQTGAPIITKEMDDLFTIHWNRALTYLGINNIGVQDKKERLVVAETSGNDMLIQMNFTNALDQRREAIDKVNAMFGTNIEVKTAELETIQTAINSAYTELMAMGQAKGVNNPEEKEDKE